MLYYQLELELGDVLFDYTKQQDILRIKNAEKDKTESTNEARHRRLQLAKGRDYSFGTGALKHVSILAYQLQLLHKCIIIFLSYFINITNIGLTYITYILYMYIYYLTLICICNICYLSQYNKIYINII